MNDQPIKTVIDEIADDLPLAKKLVTALKNRDKAAIISLLPEVAAEAKQDFDAAVAAAPEFKAGYKTTEFWLVFAVLALNAAYPLITGQPFPLETTTVLSALTGLYAVVRGFIKSKQGS